MIHRTDTGFKRTGLKKRFAAMILAAAVASSLAACGSSPSGAKPSDAGTTAKSGEAATEPAGDAAKQEETTGSQYAEGQFHLRIATVVTGDHAWVQMGEYMAEQLKERSGGAIEATVFPGGQLVNDEGTIDDMRTGALDIVIGSTQNAAPFVSQFQILSLAYLFPNRDVFEGLLDQDGQLFQYIQGLYDSNGLGLVLLGLSNGGQRDLHTNKPIESVADLKNIKMRTTSSATEALVWQALGTIPTAMSFNDIYSAVQSNTVAAFECTLAAFDTNALYEVANYHIKTAHQFTPTHITIGEISYNRLPEEFQDLLMEVGKEAAVLGSQIADEADDTLLDSLVEDHGLIVCEPDPAEFKAIVEELYPKIASDCDGQELLDLINGLIQ